MSRYAAGLVVASLQLSACTVQGLANAKQQADLLAQRQAMVSQPKVVLADCKSTMQTLELDPFRNKIELKIRRQSKTPA